MPASPEWGRLVGSQLWQITLLIPAVILLARLACRQRSHLAYGLLLVVLVKCVTPPVFFSPVGLFSWVEGRGQESRPAATESAPVPVAADQRTLEGSALARSDVAPADDAAPIDGTTFLTFDGAVSIPGATLRPGTYIFERVDGNSNLDLVRVLSRDRSHVYLTQFTRNVPRPARSRSASSGTLLHRKNESDDASSTSSIG